MLGVSKYKKEASRPDSRSIPPVSVTGAGFAQVARNGHNGDMVWVFLAVSVLGLLHAINGLFPRKALTPFALGSFMAAWLTNELVWHHLFMGLLWTALFVSLGVVGSPVGLVALAIMAVAEGLLLYSARIGHRTAAVMQEALAPIGPPPVGPRFPRLHLVFPFLVGRRRGLQKQRDVPYAVAAGRTLKLDATIPSAPVPGGGTRRPALIQIHGGGWVIGDKREQGLPLLTHMAAQGWVGFNVNYRLSPAATFPDHLVDLKAALAWIRQHADAYNIDPDFICVTGGSAGGHLTALMGLTAGDPRFQPGFEDADTSVAAAVPFYGIYDFTPDGTFGSHAEMYRRFLEPIVMKAFVADEPRRFEEASPVHHLSESAPAFLVVHGDHDTLAPVEDARIFVERLRAVSTQPVLYAELPGAEHAFEVFPSERTARTVEGVAQFLSDRWERRHAPQEAGLHADAPALVE